MLSSSYIFPGLQHIKEESVHLLVKSCNSLRIARALQSWSIGKSLFMYNVIKNIELKQMAVVFRGRWRWRANLCVSFKHTYITLHYSKFSVVIKINVNRNFVVYTQTTIQYTNTCNMQYIASILSIESTLSTSNESFHNSQ